MLRMDKEVEKKILEVINICMESKDQITGLHVRNTGKYAKIISEELQKSGKYRITDKFCEVISYAATLHDTGKLAIHDIILKEENKYTAEEYECMKKHSILGSEIIGKVIELFPDSVYLKEAKVLAELHHEKWDGSGYPHGLKGKEIPVSARIMAVADVFDALISERQDKDAFDFDKSVQIIKSGSGSHFDPEIVQAFLNAKDRIYQELMKNKK